MTENMLICPECGDAFDTIADDAMESNVVQARQQQCPSCDYTVAMSIINYPDGTYELVAPSLDDTCAVCGDDATIRTVRVGDTLSGLCDTHCGSHRIAAMDLANDI